MNRDEIPEIQDKDLREGWAKINGEKHSLLYAKIANQLRKGVQPRILILADPGYGKTYAAGRIAEKLHNELDFLDGKFKPQEQIITDPIELSKKVTNQTGKIFHVPDADSIFPSDEYHTPKNKTNRDLQYLSRRFNNILMYDAHEMSKVSKAIRTNHTTRLSPRYGPNDYYWHIEAIERDNTSKKEEHEELDMVNHKFKKPSKETRERIEEIDQKNKLSKIKEREKEMKQERKKEELKKKAFT